MSSDTKNALRDILSTLKAKFNLSDAHLNVMSKDIAEEIADADAEERQEIIAQLEAEIAQSEYFVETQVGSGAFGNVYQGYMKKDKKPCAIKIIDLEESKDDIQTICKEISTLVNSKGCPQLINYYGSTVLGTKLWIAMEYVDGGSILDKIKKSGKVLNEEQIAYVVHEVLLGLQFLNMQGKIHRDIKAANILLSKTGQVKLADFGATAQLTDTMTKCSTFVGSPYWMAPEVMTQPNYDGKADIWSLGITCYEMANGHPPNHNIHPMQVVSLIPRKPPPTLGPNFSAEFNDFVNKCLVKDPTQRPAIKDLLKTEFVQKAPKQCPITFDS